MWILLGVLYIHARKRFNVARAMIYNGRILILNANPLYSLVYNMYGSAACMLWRLRSSNNYCFCVPGSYLLHFFSPKFLSYYSNKLYSYWSGQHYIFWYDFNNSYNHAEIRLNDFSILPNILRTSVFDCAIDARRLPTIRRYISL